MKNLLKIITSCFACLIISIVVAGCGGTNKPILVDNILFGYQNGFVKKEENKDKSTLFFKFTMQNDTKEKVVVELSKFSFKDDKDQLISPIESGLKLDPLKETSDKIELEKEKAETAYLTIMLENDKYSDKTYKIFYSEKLIATAKMNK